MLDFGAKFKNLFKHSSEYSQGLGNERKGQSEFVVAKDGTGDFDNIQEAINSILTTGKTIKIKEGIYVEDLVLKSNVTLKGDGWNTEIIIKGYTGIQLTGLTSVEFRDLKITITATDAGDSIHIDMDSALKLTFNNVFFEVTNTNSSEGIMWTSGGNPASNVRIINCKGENSGTGNCTRFFYAELDFLLFQGNTMKVWSVDADDAHIDHSIIRGNFLKTVYLMAGSDNNAVTTNVLDDAATNLGAGNEVAHNTLF